MTVDKITEIQNMIDDIRRRIDHIYEDVAQIMCEMSPLGELGQKIHTLREEEEK